VLIDLAGLVVRWVDTPGLGRGADEIAREAEEIARGVAARADLMVACGDGWARPPEIESAGDRLTVATRADLGVPAWPYDLAVSALHGRGVPELVTRVRDVLVPPVLVADGRPWRFWEEG
jgi:predicted GTPase